MKILQLVDSLEIGGTERMCVNIANMLSSHNIENKLVVTRAPHSLKPLLNRETEILLTNKKSRWDLFTFLKIYRFVRKIKPNYIHSHSTTLFWACLLKILIPTTKLIWHDHYGNRKVSGDKIIHKVLSIFLNATITVNDELTHWHHNYLLMEPSNIKYLPNFPVLKNISFQNRDIKTIVINANLLPVKNHMMLLKALVIVHRKKIEFKLIIIGKEIDEHYTNTLKVFIQENGLGNNVMLMGQVTDIEKFLGLASIGVITSNSEGLPMSLLEYGLAKLAVISTNVGQCASVLKDGEFGWIVEPNDVESLAKVIELLLMNPSLVEDKSSKFYEHIKTEFSGECFFEEYNSYLNTL
ncbi:MAG TPA: hypothetical protein DIU05_11930 [Bacteroidetes bacterium]|jgi:glycosyltransferase involved in cell wall biosynthesis|nr:hypothetical protein [Bacteroidota bacterium]